MEPISYLDTKIIHPDILGFRVRDQYYGMLDFSHSLFSVHMMFVKPFSIFDSKILFLLLRLPSLSKRFVTLIRMTHTK